MAEEIAAVPITTEETSPMTEESTAPPEELSPNDNLTDAPPEEEEKAKEAAADPSETADTAETAEVSPSAADHKRKLEDLEGDTSEGGGGAEESEKKDENEGKISEADDPADAKRQRLDDGGVDGLGADGGQDIQQEEAPLVGNGQLPYTENIESGPDATIQNSNEGDSQQGNLLSACQQETSRRIEVPNNKVGVLIGKAGETIKLLQNNSGARIQIARDSEADPNFSTRPVELTGTVENMNKAEQLIKNVIAEADAGGSPALVARGFGSTQSDSDVYEMQVSSEKVGWIIGKGGENIKSMQAKSHARIQLIPQHLPEGDFSKERTVRITGNKKQIEDAKSIIKDVMNQAPRQSSFSSGRTQGYRPRGPATMPQWGPRRPPHTQSQAQPNKAYDYPQRGAYPPQTTQYPQQSYVGGYPQQPPPRNNWEQRPAGPVQTPGGYDYYGNQPSNTASAPTPAPVNYNYGQPQAAGYGQSNQPQQSYGHGYNEPKYDSQASAQPIYGQQQQPVSAQAGFYPQQGSTPPQAGYAQQPPYGKQPAYAGAPQSYGPARTTQPGDPAYQGQVPSSYGPGGHTQQPYPYGSGAQSQQPGPAYAQNYGPASVEGYNQQQPTGAYSQPNSQVAPAYGQGGQPVTAYTQPGSYGQYPQAQSAYGEQTGANVNYGYQGGAEAGYGNSAPGAGYGAAPPGGAQPQPGYVQAGGYAQPAATAYDQSTAPQAGYPGGAAVGYAKGVSPQPGGYAGQYESAPAYGQH